MPRALKPVTSASTRRAAPRAPSTNILSWKFTGARPNNRRQGAGMDNSRWKPLAPVIFHPLSAAIVLLAALALVVWSSSLDQRPIHNDEAVNGIKFGQLWEHGGYTYDPNEHHGPALCYATLALGRLTGAPKDFDWFSESRLRFTTV